MVICRSACCDGHIHRRTLRLVEVANCRTRLRAAILFFYRQVKNNAPLKISFVHSPLAPDCLFRLTSSCSSKEACRRSSSWTNRLWASTFMTGSFKTHSRPVPFSVSGPGISRLTYTFRNMVMLKEEVGDRSMRLDQAWRQSKYELDTANGIALFFCNKLPGLRICGPFLYGTNYCSTSPTVRELRLKRNFDQS